jgi:hypothetical protein
VLGVEFAYKTDARIDFFATFVMNLHLLRNESDTLFLCRVFLATEESDEIVIFANKDTFSASVMNENVDAMVILAARVDFPQFLGWMIMIISLSTSFNIQLTEFRFKELQFQDVDL